MRRFLFILLVLSFFKVYAGTSSFVTVGSIVLGCQFADISSAVNNLNGATEVRVVDGTYSDDIIISTVVDIKGGYSTCANANANIVGNTRAEINPAGSSSIIKIVNSTGDITFNNLIIAGGSTVIHSGAGIQVINHNGHLLLDNVSVDDNGTHLNGGGLYITTNTSGINTRVEIVNSEFTNNRAGVGGGIYCETSSIGGITMDIYGDTLIQSNVANYSTTGTGRGGGLYLNACIVNFYSGDSEEPVTLGIDSNTADREGGGIYAKGASYVSLYGAQYCDASGCKGDYVKPVSLTNNSAQNGGAIYATGTDTYVELVHGYVHANSASVSGGGVDVRDSALFFVRRNSKECWNRARCNLFSENLSITSGLGGAVYNQSSSNVEISGAFFEDNSADVGAAIYTLGSGANTKLINSVFNHNGGSSVSAYAGSYLIRTFSSARTEIYHTTIADNIVNDAILGIAGDTELILQNSIIQGTGNVINTTSQGVSSVSCLVAHELDSFITPPSGQSVATPTPDFENPSNRDYHLTGFSMAIDRCAVSSLMTSSDIDYEARPWDDSIPNLGGSYDAGADESYANDIIFKNGF